MSTEDILYFYESREREVDELLWRVIPLLKENHPSVRLAKDYLRFEKAIIALRFLDDEMAQARGDLVVAARRLKGLIGRKRPSPFGRRHELVTAWVEVQNSCGTYRHFVVTSYEALRAALALIFLH